MTYLELLIPQTSNPKDTGSFRQKLDRRVHQDQHLHHPLALPQRACRIIRGKKAEARTIGVLKKPDRTQDVESIKIQARELEVFVSCFVPERIAN
jgi:hypothetical protein